MLRRFPPSGTFDPSGNSLTPATIRNTESSSERIEQNADDQIRKRFRWRNGSSTTVRTEAYLGVGPLWIWRQRRVLPRLVRGRKDPVQVVVRQLIEARLPDHRSGFGDLSDSV